MGSWYDIINLTLHVNILLPVKSSSEYVMKICNTEDAVIMKLIM